MEAGAGAERSGEVEEAELFEWLTVVFGLKVTNRCGRGAVAAVGGDSKGDDSFILVAIAG